MRSGDPRSIDAAGQKIVFEHQEHVAAGYMVKGAHKRLRPRSLVANQYRDNPVIRKSPVVADEMQSIG